MNFEPGVPRVSNSFPIIRIPTQRPWRDIDEPCPTFNCGHCPREKLVDVDRAVDAAVELVGALAATKERTPPIVISRVYRGGKTTLIELISKELRKSE
jgi:hypothetical protein